MAHEFIVRSLRVTWGSHEVDKLDDVIILLH